MLIQVMGKPLGWQYDQTKRSQSNDTQMLHEIIGWAEYDYTIISSILISLLWLNIFVGDLPYCTISKKFLELQKLFPLVKV